MSRAATIVTVFMIIQMDIIRDNASSTKLANSGASVTVYYNNTRTTYNPPNSAGTHWTVFTFTTGGSLVEVGSMKHTRLPNDVY